ncbi:TetR family transcriptional regulator C-terminal domain-containing protein [Robertkochia flava]|uniref:TetR family transcriptional regulator C-terminal domain-containing protein n=1 Tax=Robertkochia flava TaxID=3447986 RepID=UPI001CCAEC3A|nr:TetR family transcriptional regulator C-terminal domain-containing protein [Robertkochia marina]
MTAKKTEKKEQLSAGDILNHYMTWILENNRKPESVYHFCKELGITEPEFYKHYASISALDRGVWNGFYDHAMSMLEKDHSFQEYGNREKLLSFYYTFMELLNLNRSYVLYVTREGGASLKELEQLQGLRKRVKDFAKELIEQANEDKKLRLNKRSPELFSEGAWVQLLVIIRFWIADESPGFEKTDVFIEKSVNTVFDLFESTPIEKVLDLGKFLWQERMSR